MSSGDLLNDLKAASQRAAETFAVACPAENDLAETAPGRIATIIGRLKATDEAIMTVKPALEAFYASLSDEQKQRFDTLGPKEPRTASRGGTQHGRIGTAARQWLRRGQCRSHRTADAADRDQCAAD